MLANIDYMRKGDQKWTQQFNAIFCVLNASGQVMSWKLTKSAAFENCKDILENIKERLNKNNQELREFVIDNCCHWRKKIQQIFGEDIKVLLDLFHAIQRVIVKIPKRHPLRQKCCHDFRLVFQDVTDSGTERTQNTPSSGKTIRMMTS